MQKRVHTSIIWLLSGCSLYFIFVAGDVVLNSFIEFKTIFGGVQADVVVFNRFPKTPDPDIIQGSDFSVHRYFYAGLSQVMCPTCASILSSLIGMQDFWQAMYFDGLFQHGHTPARIQRVADRPS